MDACLAHVHVYKPICARTLAYMCIFMCRGGVGVYVRLCRGACVFVFVCECVYPFFENAQESHPIILSLFMEYFSRAAFTVGPYVH